MAKNNQQPRNQFVICPVCGGSGKNKYGLSCPHCSGMGLGIFRYGRFFYWGLKLGRAVIELDHLRRKFHLVLNIISFAVGLGGLVALGWWGYTVGVAVAPKFDDLAFWHDKNALILFFWLSIIADMFLVYRFSEAERWRRGIRYFRYEERKMAASTPNNWEELKAAGSKYKVDIVEGCAPGTLAVVEQSFLLAHQLGHKYIAPIHIFFSSLADQEVAAVLSRLNIDRQKLIDRLKVRMAKIERGRGSTRLSNTAKELLLEAYLHACDLGQSRVEAKDLIIPCLDKDKMIAEILYDFAVDKDKIYNVILWFIVNKKLMESYRVYKRKARFKPASVMNRAYTAIATPTLDYFGHDLTLAAKWGRLEYCVSRGETMEKIWQCFASGQNGVMLVGPVGVGKSTIVDGIAQLMVREDVPQFITDKRLVEIDIARLVSGVAPAQAHERLLVAMDEVARAGNIVLFFDNIENLMGITSGTEESMDLSEVLANGIDSHGFYCLATATTSNYIKYIEGRPLGNAMAVLKIDEPMGNQAIQIVESKIGHLESKYNVYFSYNAIELVIELSKKYIHDKYLPQKAIDILELVAVKVAKRAGRAGRRRGLSRQAVVNKEDIAAAVSAITNIPLTKITEKEGRNLLRLEELIHQRMINQEEAVKMVASSLRRSRTQLRESKRPISSFLFLGPTGVGKTELAKTVADIYFGNKKYMIRLDMSEYRHPDSIKKMIGDAEGVKGYLTEAMRRMPFSLVLLDEFEKAHPDILNLFLQVMDDGRLTDGQGRTIHFTNSIIIATSNAGALYIQEQVRAGTDIRRIKEVLINQYLNKVMRPELINRFDGVIVFKPLSMDNVADITRLMLAQIGKLLENKGIELQITNKGVERLAKEGYDPEFGARPLRRLLQEKIEDAVANKILSGELARRDAVVIKADGNIEVVKGRKI